MKTTALLAITGLVFLIQPSPDQANAGAIWTQEGSFDRIAMDPTKPGLTIREYVPAKSVVTLFPTSNGEIIKNANGSSPFWKCDNSMGGRGFTDTFDTLAHVTQINNKNLTDIRQRTKYNPAGTLQAAAFDVDGSMLQLGPWLYDSGFVDRPLGIPDFSSPTEPELFFGVSLEDWALEGFVMSEGSLGSIYQVADGVATSRISGGGPTASQLSSFFLSAAELTPAAGGGWMGVGYTGTTELFGWHELRGVAPVPEPGAVILVLTGLATIGLGRLLSRRGRGKGISMAAETA